MDKFRLQNNITGIRNHLAKYSLIITAYFFGSRIKGNNIPSSDLDLGIICRNKINISPLEISLNLQKIISGVDLDVLLLDLESDPLILIQVINGKLIYQSNLSERLILETRILRLYEEYQRLTKIRRYYLDKSFKEGIYAG